MNGGFEVPNLKPWVLQNGKATIEVKAAYAGERGGRRLYGSLERKRDSERRMLDGLVQGTGAFR